MEAISDDTRRRIIETLSETERSAGELASLFDISRPGVSRHLRVLREAGLVSCRREAQRRVYALSPEPLAEVDAWLSRYRRLWAERLDALGAEVQRMKQGGPTDDQ